MTYAGYSYRDHADRFQRDLSVAETARLQAAADSVKFSTLRDQIRTVAFRTIEVFATR